MRISWRRVGAIFRKELREYRRNGNILYAMAVLPMIFVIAFRPQGLFGRLGT